MYILHIPVKSAIVDTTTTTPVPQKPITGQLARSLHLKHNAPIVGITVFDSTGVPLEMAEGIKTANHRVVVATEEQFKIYPLPLLKGNNNNNVIKYKLTALEGVRVRRMCFARFTCKVPANIVNALNNAHKSPPKVDTSSETATSPTTSQTSTVVSPVPPKHTEIGLLCLTNAGDCLVFSVPELKRQINAAAVRREDIK